NAPILAQLEEFQRDPVVVIHHVMAVTFRRIGTCALMQYDIDTLEVALSHLRPEIVLVHVVGDVAADQVADFVTFGEIVHRENVGITAPIQAADKIAADEAGGSGDYDHDSSPAVTTEVPSLPTTIPPALLAQYTDSCQPRPAARATASVARTVSPAPDTSKDRK